MKNSFIIGLLIIVLLPCYISAVSSYEELLSRESNAYMLHNIESVSFDGHIWSRQHGMKEYYLTPQVKDIQSYIFDVKGDDAGTGGYKLIKVELTARNIDLLAEYQVNVPDTYPKAHLNVLIPSKYATEFVKLNAGVIVEDFAFSKDSIPADRTSRQVVYEEDFESNLGNEYGYSTYIDDPNLLYRNLQWGLVDCESYEGEQSIWCTAELSGNGILTSPPDPCTHYRHWTWNLFAREQTIDVTVAEELVFEYWTNYGLDPTGYGDYMRVWVIDYPTTDWEMVGEYTGYTPDWTDMQLELEDFSNFAYYFEFESDDQEFSTGIFVDNVSVYNMVPNLTWGEDSSGEYPYNYSVEEPHNLLISYVVENDSNADVEDAFSTDILLSVDDDYTTEDDNYVLETVDFPGGLDSYESVAGEVITNLDEYQTSGGESLPPGSYYVMFMVDIGEEIEEYDEEDNLWAPTNQIEFGNVNLTYGAGSSYAYPVTPGTAQLQVTSEVLNDGTEACATQFTNGFLISIDNDITTTDDNYELGYVTYPDPIAAGGTSVQNLTVDLNTMTDIPADDFWVFCVIDVYANVNEADENDNIWMSASQFTYEGQPYLEVLPLVLNFDFNAASQNLNISSNTTWNASESADWISLSVDNGTGDAGVSVTVTDNVITDPRSAVITFTGAGETINVTVNQEANTAVLYGDVDGSLVVDAYDASMVLQYVVGIPTGIDPFPVINANVDGVDDVSSFDAALILQYTVGIIDEFPVEAGARKE